MGKNAAPQASVAPRIGIEITYSDTHNTQHEGTKQHSLNTHKGANATLGSGPTHEQVLRGGGSGITRPQEQCDCEYLGGRVGTAKENGEEPK